MAFQDFGEGDQGFKGIKGGKGGGYVLGKGYPKGFDKGQAFGKGMAFGTGFVHGFDDYARSQMVVQPLDLMCWAILKGLMTEKR